MPSAKDLLADITSTLSSRNTRMMEGRDHAAPQTWTGMGMTSFTSNQSNGSFNSFNKSPQPPKSTESSDPFLM